MKTAEQWGKEYYADLGLPFSKRKLKHRNGDFARAIQLDAIKEGMIRAAEITRQVGLQYGDYDISRDGRVVGNAANQSILAAAELLTKNLI